MVKTITKKQPVAKKQPSHPWKVPRHVPRSNVRAHLAAITRHAAAGNEVLVGISDASAFSSFISEAEFERRKASFPVTARDMDIETLRTNWSKEREQVENTGGPLRVLRKKACIAVFVPTRRALDKKVSRTLETLKMSHIDQLHHLGQRVANLEAIIHDFTDGILRPESIKEMHKTMALAGTILREWRKQQGHDGEPPLGPPD